VHAVGLPAQRAIAQRFSALARFYHSRRCINSTAIGGEADIAWRSSICSD